MDSLFSVRRALLQMQDFMKLYSGLVERCFNNCVNDFTSKVLTGKEVRSTLSTRKEKEEASGKETKLTSVRFPSVFGVGSYQSTCVSHCSDKFLKHSERVGARFAEHNAGELSVVR